MITVAQRDYQGGLSQPRHSHDNMSVTLVLAGTIRERVGNVEEIARPLSLVVKPVDVEHENLFGPGRVRTLQILLDGRDAGQVCQANPATRRWRWIHFGLQIRPFLTLARSLRSGDSDAVELLTIDALASIDTLPTAPGGAPSILRTVRQRLDDESSPPRVRDLAAGADVHPVYLARLFRRYYGTTISHYVRRRRIRGVIARMSRPASSLSMAAHEAGFADHAHMCRTFRAETGMAPSEYRLIIT